MSLLELAKHIEELEKIEKPELTEQEKFAKEFQKQVALKCADEVFELRKHKIDDPKKTEEEKKAEEFKNLTEVMKKYETKIYERYIQKAPVAELEKRNEREDLIRSSIKYNFTGEAGFLSDYNRLLRGYKDEEEFSKQREQQKVDYKVKMPKEIGTHYPDNPYTLEKKNYVDTQANSKHYFPQDYQLHYDNTNIYNNKPTSDIGNQQKLYMSSPEGMFDPYVSQGQGFGNSATQGFRSQGGTGIAQQIVHNPYTHEDDVHLRRTIDMLGGITRTVPNMEKSLYDHELRNIEKNYRYHGNFDNTSNSRMNTLLQNQINNVYGPQFDGPGAIAASPERGGLPNLQKPGLYYSPSKRGYGEAPVVQPAQMSQPLFQPQIEHTHGFGRQNALAERSMNDAYRPTFNSSKSLRGEKMDMLNPQFNLPRNIF